MPEHPTPKAPSRAIYLDHAASTPTDPALAEAVAAALAQAYANPSSGHAAGVAAGARLAAARERIERHVPGYRAVFTASGSEALNLAIKGAWDRCDAAGEALRAGNRILISAVEHPAVFYAAHDLAKHRGARVIELPVDERGMLDLEAAEAELRKGDVAIVACMAVQNELGTIEPIEELGRLIRSEAREAFFVVDAVQALGKIPLGLGGGAAADWQADAVAVSSHKVMGPKRVGALLLRADHVATLRPLVHGGGQELGLVSGTESVAYAEGFAAAFDEAVSHQAEHAAVLYALRARFFERLTRRLPDYVINGPSDVARVSPAVASFSIPGLWSHQLLLALSDEGIFISAGSACHAGAAGPSRTQRACGFAEERGRGAVRVSFGVTTTEAEVDRAADRIAFHADVLRRSALAPTGDGKVAGVGVGASNAWREGSAP